MTVKELIEKLKKMPQDYDIDINIDDAYSSKIRNIYVDTYEKNQGNDVVTIKV